MDGTGAAHLPVGRFTGVEADQAKELSQGDQGADLGEANAGHRGDRGTGQEPLRDERSTRPGNREEEPVLVGTSRVSWPSWCFRRTSAAASAVHRLAPRRPEAALRAGQLHDL